MRVLSTNTIEHSVAVSAVGDYSSASVQFCPPMSNMEGFDHAKEAAKSLGLNTCTEENFTGSEFNMELMGKVPVVQNSIVSKDEDEPSSPSAASSKAFDLQEGIDDPLEDDEAGRSLSGVRPQVLREVLFKYESETNCKRSRMTTVSTNSDVEDEDEDEDDEGNASDRCLSGIHPEVLKKILLKVEDGTYKQDIGLSSMHADPLPEMPMINDIAANIKQICQQQRGSDEPVAEMSSWREEEDVISNASTSLMNSVPPSSRCKSTAYLDDVMDYQASCSFHFLVTGFTLLFVLWYIFVLCGRPASYSF